jgi:chorismate mutase
MVYKKFIKVKTEDDIDTKIQDNISDAIDQITRNPILDSQQLVGISVTSGAVNKIPHKLGRVLTGYSVMPHADTRFWDTQVNNKSPNLFLYLNVSTSCLVDLVVW